MEKSKIHIALTDGHPNKEAENSIYYMYYQKGAFLPGQWGEDQG